MSTNKSVCSKKTLYNIQACTISKLRTVRKGDDSLRINLKRSFSYEMFVLANARERVFHLLERCPLHENRLQVQSRHKKDQII